MIFFKQILFFAVICILIGSLMQLMNYDQAYLLQVLGGFLSLIAFVFAVKDLHQMKGLIPMERFYLALILLFANLPGLIVYAFYHRILEDRSAHLIEYKEKRWDKITGND